MAPAAIPATVTGRRPNRSDTRPKMRSVGTGTTA